MKDYREYIKKQKEKIVDLSTGNRVIEKIEEEIQEMYFKNGKKLESHYDNHGTILGYSTSGEYLNASINSLEKPPHQLPNHLHQKVIHTLGTTQKQGNLEL